MRGVLTNIGRDSDFQGGINSPSDVSGADVVEFEAAVVELARNVGCSGARTNIGTT